MKLTIAFDDISLPLPPMRRPDIRQRVIEAVLDQAAEAGVDDVAPHRRPGAAPAHDRGRAAPRGRRPRLRRLRPPRPALQPRRRGPRQPRLPGHHAPGRGGRDQQAGRRERPARLRQHQPRVDGRRPQVHRHRPGQLPQPAPPPQRADHAAQPQLHGPPQLRAAQLATGAWARCSRDAGVKIFQIETTLNNDTFGTSGPMSVLQKREWEWSAKDRATFVGMQAGPRPPAAQGPPQDLPRRGRRPTA